MNESIRTSSQKKHLTLISVIVGIICTLLVLLGMNTVINGSFFELPILEMIADEDEIDSMNEQIAEYADEVADASDEEKEVFEDVTGMSIEKAEKFMKTPSLNAFIKFAQIEEFGIDDEDVEVFTTIRVAVIVYALVIALFSLLGALLKKKAFTIIALIISLPFFIFLVGILHMILFTILCIVHVVLLSMAKKSSNFKM